MLGVPDPRRKPVVGDRDADPLPSEGVSEIGVEVLAPARPRAAVDEEEQRKAFLSFRQVEVQLVPLRVRRVALLPEEFSIDGGEMTPTLKVKRRVIDEKYGQLIDELYGGTGKDEEGK